MDGYFLGLYEKSMPNTLTIKEKMIEACKAGFNFLELSIDESDEKLKRLKWNDKQKLDIINASIETGVKILSICLSGHRRYPIGSEDEKIRRKGMEIMSGAIDFAFDLGIRVIQIAGYDEYYRPSTEKTRKFFFENLKASVQMAAKKGVILAFETMETEFLNTIDKAMYYVNKINSPYLQVYPDLGNITNAAINYKKNVSDDIMSGEGHIAALHLKESLPGKFREIPYGKGHVDFEEAIKLTYKMGVKIYLAEFWYTGNDDWGDQLKLTNQFLRSKFKEVSN
ncbi:MAG TPA: L-ribulose-5-phosphate 3-epimerase [Bacteroidales bacterium]|nr:L-ribulose-5-phosphate 3-epimerase [Bacteroidales bacterium]